MPGTGRAEIYFIVAMMVLTFVLSGFAMYFFVKTYRKEMREREAERAARQHAAPAAESRDQNE
jgi:large-conductance mechanosensitive channel